MKLLAIFLLMFSLGARAEEICEDFPIDEGQPFVWNESDFTQESAIRSLEDLQNVIKNSGQIGSCGLPNALAIVEGYILKQQTLEALSNPTTSDMVKNYTLAEFCEFIRRSSPCE